MPGLIILYFQQYPIIKPDEYVKHQNLLAQISRFTGYHPKTFYLFTSFQVHCIREVLWLHISGSPPFQTWTCDIADCTCAGGVQYTGWILELATLHAVHNTSSVANS